MKTVYFFHGNIFPMGMPSFSQQIEENPGEHMSESNHEFVVIKMHLAYLYNSHYYFYRNHILLNIRGRRIVSCKKEEKL